MVGLPRLLSLSYVSVYNSSRLSAVQMSRIPNFFGKPSWLSQLPLRFQSLVLRGMWIMYGFLLGFRVPEHSQFLIWLCMHVFRASNHRAKSLQVARYVGLYVQLLPCHVCLVVGTHIWASKHSCIWFLAIFQPQFVPSFIRVHISSPWLIQGSSILDLLVQILLV
jgi:hypothetical protein